MASFRLFNIRISDVHSMLKFLSKSLKASTDTTLSNQSPLQSLLSPSTEEKPDKEERTEGELARENEKEKKRRKKKVWNVFAFSALIETDQIFIHRSGLAIISQIFPSYSPSFPSFTKLFVQ